MKAKNATGKGPKGIKRPAAATKGSSAPKAPEAGDQVDWEAGPLHVCSPLWRFHLF